MTFTVDGASHDIEQVTKQLYKVIEVVKITDVTAEAVVARELALIKVSASKESRGSTRGTTSASSSALTPTPPGRT